MTSVHLRFFASARAAAGTDGQRVELWAGATIQDALELVAAAPGQPIDRVLARCSFLVNTVATTDRATALSDGDTVDVMPPFAGG